MADRVTPNRSAMAWSRSPARYARANWVRSTFRGLGISKYRIEVVNGVIVLGRFWFRAAPPIGTCPLQSQTLHTSRSVLGFWSVAGGREALPLRLAVALPLLPLGLNLPTFHTPGFPARVRAPALATLHDRASGSVPIIVRGKYCYPQPLDEPHSKHVSQLPARIIRTLLQFLHGFPVYPAPATTGTCLGSRLGTFGLVQYHPLRAI